MSPDIQHNGTEQTISFWSGRLGLGGDHPDRYTSVIVYVFRHAGAPISVIIRPGGDCYTVAAARRQAALMAEAIAWLEVNVPELT